MTTLLLTLFMEREGSSSKDKFSFACFERLFHSVMLEESKYSDFIVHPCYLRRAMLYAKVICKVL